MGRKGSRLAFMKVGSRRGEEMVMFGTREEANESSE
jgi:hypothetical protein